MYLKFDNLSLNVNIPNILMNKTVKLFLKKQEPKSRLLKRRSNQR